MILLGAYKHNIRIQRGPGRRRLLLITSSRHRTIAVCTGYRRVVFPAIGGGPSRCTYRQTTRCTHNSYYPKFLSPLPHSQTAACTSNFDKHGASLTVVESFSKPTYTTSKVLIGLVRSPLFE